MEKTYEELTRNNLGGEYVSAETGVAPDYINVWIMVGYVHPGSPCENDIATALASPIPHYEDYLRPRKNPHCERILADSNPQKVIAINHLADAFNALREQLIATNDAPTALAFFALADILIRGKLPEKE